MPSSERITLAITLASGERHEFGVDTMPRHWKSWLMQQLPYGTDFQGADFERSVQSSGPSVMAIRTRGWRCASGTLAAIYLNAPTSEDAERGEGQLHVTRQFDDAGGQVPAIWLEA